MSDFKHTKGPWYTREVSNAFDDGVEIRSVPDDDGDNVIGELPPIAFINTYGYDAGVEVAADAKLIAAAPELLEALQIVLGEYEHFYCEYAPHHLKHLPFRSRQDIVIAHDAIKKATT